MTHPPELLHRGLRLSIVAGVLVWFQSVLFAHTCDPFYCHFTQGPFHFCVPWGECGPSGFGRCFCNEADPGDCGFEPDSGCT